MKERDRKSQRETERLKVKRGTRIDREKQRDRERQGETESDK